MVNFYLKAKINDPSFEYGTIEILLVPVCGVLRRLRCAVCDVARAAAQRGAEVARRKGWLNGVPVSLERCDNSVHVSRVATDNVAIAQLVNVNSGVGRNGGKGGSSEAGGEGHALVHCYLLYLLGFLFTFSIILLKKLECKNYFHFHFSF